MRIPVPQTDHNHGVYHAAALEDQLARQLREVSAEVDRSECFDADERAEVYAIIEALQTDTRAHRKAIRLMTGQGGGDA